MKLWYLLPRLLSILAVLSLPIAVTAAPSAAGVMVAGPMAQMDMAGLMQVMPCCPGQAQSLPDCQKSCPLATLCVTKCFPNLPTVSGSDPAVLMILAILIPWDDAVHDLLGEPPPPRPPKP